MLKVDKILVKIGLNLDQFLVLEFLRASVTHFTSFSRDTKLTFSRLHIATTKNITASIK